MLTQENCKGAKGNRQTFLLDQAAGLQESPFPVLWKAPFAERKFLQRNPSSLDVDLVWVATKIGDGASQRFRANQNQGHCIEHLSRGFSIGWLVHVHHDIRSVKGDDQRVFPRTNQRQEMYGDVAEVNVQEASVGFS